MLRAIRFRDALVFEAPAIVGIAFSMPALTDDSLLRFLPFAFASFLLMAHIFVFNDWSDRIADSLAGQPPAMADEPPLDANHNLWLALGLAVAGVSLLGLLSVRLLLLSSLILLFGVAYSFPMDRFKAKGIPLLSSALHFGGSVLTFLLGYALFSEINARGLVVGGYFGLIISAGHLVQEVQDFEADRAANIATHAVALGPRKAFLLGFVLFTVSFAYLYLLAAAGVLPEVVGYFLVFYPVLCLLGLDPWRSGLEHNSVHRFRGQYRVLFGLMVVLLMVAVLAQSPGWLPG